MSGIKNLPLLSHAALDSRELGDQLAGADEAGDGGALGIAGDGGALGIEAKAGLALPVGRDAVVGDKSLHGIRFRREWSHVGNPKGRLADRLPRTVEARQAGFVGSTLV